MFRKEWVFPVLFAAASAPAFGAAINTIGVGTNAGTNDCSDAPLPGTLTSSGLITTNMTLSRSAGAGSCEVEYDGRAGGGSVGVGLTQLGEKTGESDDFFITATTQFDLVFEVDNTKFTEDTIDISTSALLTAQLGADGVEWNGGSNITGSIFLGGSLNNTAPQTTRSLPTFTVKPGLSFNTLNIAQTYTTDTITVDPTKIVTIKYTLTATTGGIASSSRNGEYTLTVEALDSFGLALNQSVINGLPDGVSLLDDPTIGIVDGIFVGLSQDPPSGTMPVPSTALMLLSGFGLLAIRRRKYC